MKEEQTEKQEQQKEICQKKTTKPTRKVIPKADIDMLTLDKYEEEMFGR